MKVKIFGLIFAFLLIVPVSYGSPVTWYFTGIFTYHWGDVDTGLLGSSFSGQLIYDPEWVETTDPFSTAQTYIVPPGALSASFAGGSATSKTGAEATVFYDWTVPAATYSGEGDGLYIGEEAEFNDIYPDATLTFMALSFFDDTEGLGGALSVTSASQPLPTTLSTLSSWDATEFIISYENEYTEFYAGALTTLSTIPPNPIPEPTSLLLLGTGLGILWLGTSRRRRK